MGRLTFFDATSAATFRDLFSDTRTAAWYQLWVGNASGQGDYVDTSAFNAYGKGWLRADDLAYLDVDFARADDTALWVRPWDGSTGKEPWEWGHIDFSHARNNYITTIIDEDTAMDQMFTDYDVAGDTWYRLWIGDSGGAVGEFVDTSALNRYGNGWVRPENLSNLSFNLTDTGKDLWVQTFVSETGVKQWEHWTVQQEFFVTGPGSVNENTGSVTFTVTLAGEVPAGESVAFNYATQDGTAIGGIDYESATGVLTFAAGEISKQVQVEIVDDSISGEDNETFSFAVSNIFHDAYVGQVFENLTIVDNDDAGNQTITTPMKIGSEFRVNTQTLYHQEDPVIAPLNDGGFVVLWESQLQDGSEYGVFGQRFDHGGDPAGSEFRVNTQTDNFQWAPAAASFSNGGFVAVWQSLGQDGSGYGIYGQRFDAQGNMAGGEFQVNTRTAFNQEAPSVVTLQDDGFVVVWQSAGQDGSGYGIYGQAFDGSADVSGDEFLVNTVTADNQDTPFAFPLLDGKYVVTWSSNDQDGSGSGIYAQLYDGTAEPSETPFEEFEVNTTTEGDQTDSAGTFLADGGFVVVWASGDQDDSGYGVYGQLFDSEGETVGDEFQVNTHTFSNQEAPTVSPLADGGFVVAWESYGQDGSQEGVYGQRYSGTGETIGLEFLLNTTTHEDQDAPCMAPLFDTGFVAAWGSDDQDGSYEGIYGQLFSINAAEAMTQGAMDDDQTQAIQLTGVQAQGLDGLFLL